MDSFDESAFDLPLEFFIDDVASSNFSWIDPSSSLDIDFSQTSNMIRDQEYEEQPPKSFCFEVDFSQSSSVLQDNQECEIECPKKSSSLEIDFSQTSNMIRKQEYEGQPPRSFGFEIDFSQSSSVLQDNPECEIECPKKRGRTMVCSTLKTKACRERERREKLNDSFVNLSTVLEPGRATKTDKLAIIADAIRVIKQIRTENEEHKVELKRRLHEIETLKAENYEIRNEKSTIKAEKEKIELQLKSMSFPGCGLLPPPYAPTYQTGPNKVAIYPSYGMYPMWHYIPPSIRDTSRDHELRPPAA